jgi:hypothetical protein
MVATAKITGDTHRHDNAQEHLVESYRRESCLSRQAIAAEWRRGKDSRDQGGIAIGGHRPATYAQGACHSSAGSIPA